MDQNSFGRTGWCQNIAHAEHLHTIDKSCTEPTTLDERLNEMREVAQKTGHVEPLTEKIEKLREQAAEKAFQEVMIGYKGPSYHREEES